MRVWLIGIVFTLAVAGVIAFPILTGGQLTLEVGDVATRDVRSPRRVTFTSDNLTEEARKKAEASVAPIYTPPDGHIARQQIARARAVADFIRAVRADPYATPAQKQAALAALEGVPFSSAQVERIVSLRDEAWAKIESETLNVLDLALRGEIREANISQVRSRIPTMVERGPDRRTSLYRQHVGPVIHRAEQLLGRGSNHRRARQSAPIGRAGHALLRSRSDHCAGRRKCHGT